MKKTRRATEQIIRILREADTGLRTEGICRRRSISSQSFYRWKSKYGGMDLKEAQRLRDLEKENTELKKLLADQLLKTKALEIALGKTSEPGAPARDCGEGPVRAVAFRESRLPMAGDQPLDAPLPSEAQARGEALAGAGDRPPSGGASDAWLPREQEAGPARPQGGGAAGSASPPSQAAAGALRGASAEGASPQPRPGLGPRLGLRPAGRQAAGLRPDRRMRSPAPLHPCRPGDQGLRRAGPAAGGHPRAWGSRMHPLGQRARAHRQGHPGLACRERDRGSMHRSGPPLAERIRRKLQQPLPRGTPRPRADPHAQRIARDLRGLEGLLQQS